MRNTRVVFALLLLLTAPCAYAQIGKYVPIQAGSPEGHALDAINVATDPAEKLKLIEQFATDYGKGDLEIVADDLFVSYYLSAKNYDKVFEYGEKLWVADPGNFQNGVNLVRAAQEKGDAARVFEYGEKTGAIVSRFKAQPAPAGEDASQWEQRKKQTLDDAKDNINYAEQVVFMTAYRTQAPPERAADLAKFAKSFPDSMYANQALEIAAATYQQAQQYPKMLEVANGLLAKDPNDVSMLILLSDYYSEKGEQLDKADAYANKAMGLLATAKKPEGASDEDWQKQVALQRGLALSALGQVNISKKRDVQALENFKAAAPLLKPDAVTYGRNQYRMGFALINLKRYPEARVALTEAVSVNSPYKGLAQEKLNTLPGGAAKTTTRKKAS